MKKNTASFYLLYKPPKTIFTNLSFNLFRSHIHFLIGANGSGKTTLMKILAGIEDYEAGNLIFHDSLEVSYISQKLIFDENLSLKENYFFYKQLNVNHNNKTIDEELIKDLKFFRLQDVENSRIQNLSFGQRKKLQLMLNLKISSCKGQSNLWLLDEAELGLDEFGRNLLVEMMKNQLNSGSTILFSTHNKSSLINSLKGCLNNTINLS